MIAIFFAGAFLSFVLMAMAGNALRRQRDAARAELDLAERCLHHNIRAVRAATAYAFPEAESVCNTLETAFLARARADVAGLDRHLCELRRKHNDALIAGREPQLQRVRDMIEQIHVATHAVGHTHIAQHAAAALRMLEAPTFLGWRNKSLPPARDLRS